ncbi:MAG: pyrroloquinoline quinone biosynthesis peptide chaperone PqqD [Pseudomonadota bacterium]
MSGRTVIAADSIPRLARHARLQHDKRRDQWVVQAPERLFVPDPIALEIIRRCDGLATVAAIADALAGEYAAPRELILKDVNQLLQDLADKGVMTA